MKTAMLIAARELRDRRRLVAISAALATLPFMATLLPGARGNREDVIAMVGGFLAIAIGWGLAVALGVSTIGGELSAKRLSYWFAKPISPAALWLGKASAALATALACFAIVLLPAAWGARETWAARWLDNAWLPALGAAGIVVLFLVSHAVSTVVRSRSLLLGADFALAAIAAAALFAIVRPLLLAGVAKPLLIALGCAVLLVLAIAPVWQLARGRTDVRRSHAAFSQFLWPAMGVVLLLAATVVGWLLWVSPEDLDQVVDLEQAPSGTAAFVSGSAPHRLRMVSTFLIDRRTGESTRVPVTLYWGAIRLSRNGRVAAWMQPGSLDLSKRPELHVYDFETKTKTATGVTARLGSELVLSDDGTRIALRDDATLTVYDVASRKILASAAGFDPNARVVLFFVTNGLVRTVEHATSGRAAAPLRIAELDLTTRRLTRTGERLATPNYVQVSASHERMLLRSERAILDGRTGATIATLPKEGNVFSFVMLHDSSVALIVRDASSRTILRTFTRDGAARHELPLPVRVAWIAGETTDGKLIVAGSASTEPFSGRGRTMFVIDLGRGTLERAVPDTKGPMPTYHSDPRLLRYDARAGFLAVGADGKLKTWK